MNEQVENVLEASAKVKFAILACIVVLILATYWFLFCASLSEELTSINTKIDELQFEIVQKEGIAANLPKYEAKVRELDIELSKALAELPDEKEIHELLAKISDKARDAGLDIRLFRPKSEIKRDFYAEVPVEIEVYGGFHQVATFFDEVGQLKRIVNLQQFSMEEPLKVDDGISLTTSVIATSFRFLEQRERPKEEDQKRKKRRGGRRKG